MNKQYWDDVAEYYEAEIFSVLHHDSKDLIVGLIEKYGSESDVVSDLGCGIGHFLPTLSSKFEEVLAVDISQNCIDRAKEDYSHLENIQYITMDLSSRKASMPKVQFCISVNALITPSLEQRIRMFDFISDHLEQGGCFLLVLPSLESAMLCDYRQIEWNVRGGLKPSAAAKADFRARKVLNNKGLHEGVVLLDDVPTKHFLKEELIAILESRGMSIKDICKIEYTWDSEFVSPPRWMKRPYPWDWLMVAQKN